MISDSEIIEKNNLKFLVRKNTSDYFVVKEVFGGEYRKLNISSDDIIVDLGLNIGAFTLYALKKNAKKLYSYEADSENFKIAQHNITINNFSDKVELFNLAVVGNDDDTREFSLNVKGKNKGAHSLLAKRGRDAVKVKCININNVLEKNRPTIVKMDIEGAEYECIKAIKSFSGINQFIFEFHHAHLNDIKTHEKYIEIQNLLKEKYESVECRQETKGAWVNIVFCRNAI